MTIFREEFDLQFIVYFATLSFLKIFHWLCQDRIEFMEQAPVLRNSFHVRIASLLTLLLAIDTILANHAIHATLTKGPSVMIMFGFEYTILICIITSTIGKYVLNVIDMRSEQTWEGKSMFVFYLDLITDFFKLITYSLFFVYICLNYQLPLHIIRDVYVTFRSFIQKCTDLYRYRRATRNMNEQYPDATADDFSRSNDSTCIICREEMHITDPGSAPNENNPETDPNRNEQNLDQPKKLPCGHIFHFHCLRSWLERQQTCPTCRRSVLADTNHSTPDGNNLGQQDQPQPQSQQPNQTMHNQNDQAGTGNGNTFTNNPEVSHGQPRPPFTGTQDGQPLLFNGANQPMNLPTMIPLTPFTPAVQIGTPSYPESLVSTLPPDLSDEQLKTMSEMTREAIEEKIRLLAQVQNQIFQSMQLLTRVLSITPHLESKSNEEALSHHDENANIPESSGHSKQIIEEESTSSSRRKEKMPDRSYNTTLNSEEEEFISSK
ncbi:hypothetical protein G6F59_002897 [Rhizopus arrhizus]|nr:hypothetical protein G6F59_002897 [Rhizopus arrhizus]